VSRRPCACRQRPQPVCDCAAPASAAVKPALYSMPTWRPPASAGWPGRQACPCCRSTAHAAHTPRAHRPRHMHATGYSMESGTWGMQRRTGARTRARGRAARVSHPAHATVALTRLACFQERQLPGRSRAGARASDFAYSARSSAKLSSGCGPPTSAPRSTCGLRPGACSAVKLHGANGDGHDAPRWCGRAGGRRP